MPTLEIDEPLKGKILELTKCYELSPPENEGNIYPLKSSFFVKKGEFRTDGFGMEWWRTRKCNSVITDVSKILKRRVQFLNKVDLETLSDEINDFLQQNCDDEFLFDIDKMMFYEAETLFDCVIDSDYMEFTKTFVRKLLEDLKMEVHSSLVVYPVSSIDSETVRFSEFKTSLIVTNDTEVWKSFEEKYPTLKEWNPVSGIKDEDGLKFLPGGGANLWLACEVTSLSGFSAKKAKERLEIFLACMFSFLREKHDGLLMKSNEKEVSYCNIFKPDEISFESIGVLIPPLLRDIEIDGAIVSKIRNWLDKFNSSTSENKNRMTVSSHFIHSAILQSGINRFVNLFIALDGLFGQRNRVEKSIKEGLGESGNSHFTDKFEEIYELRNELVHGGSKSIKSWDGLEHYKKMFDSSPEQDLQKIVFSSCRNFFNQEQQE